MEALDRKTLLRLRKFLSPEFVFGSGARKLVPRYARNLSLSKVLLVSDEGLVKAGWAQEVQTLLEEGGIPAPLYTSVSGNPKDREVMEGAEIFRREGCSGLVVIGGGSPIDCAKGIGIVISNGGHILDYVGVDRISLPSPPLICIPTTLSASDLSSFAIISDSERNLKLAIISKALIPDVSLADPDTTRTLPAEQGRLTGMDCFIQAIEALTSRANSLFTDLFAKEAIRLSARHLPDMSTPEAMMASVCCGLAFSNAGLGLIHAMGHALGGLTDLPHGECIAMLQRPVMEFNYPAARPAYEEIARILDVEGELPLLDRIEEIGADSGSRARLSEKGIRWEDLPILADRAFRDPCAVTNPRPATVKQIEEIYARIF